MSDVSRHSISDPGRGRRRVRAAATVLATAGIVIAIAVVISCTRGAADRPGARSAVGHAPAASSVLQVHLPLDPYLLTPPEVSRLARAHRALLDQCLGRFGLTMPAPRPAGRVPQKLNERRYGITDPDGAAASGYRLTDPDISSGRPGRHTGPPPNHQLLDVLSGDGPRIVHGQPVPTGGCHSEARQRLGATPPANLDTTLAQRLSRESFFRSRQDPRVQAVTGDWSRCMRDRGYEYSDPLEVAADQRFRGPVTDTEITTATADITCKNQTDLIGVWSTVETAYQHPQLAAHQAALTRLRQAHQAQLTIAHELGIP